MSYASGVSRSCRALKSLGRMVGYAEIGPKPACARSSWPREANPRFKSQPVIRLGNVVPRQCVNSSRAKGKGRKGTRKAADVKIADTVEKELGPEESRNAVRRTVARDRREIHGPDAVNVRKA